ncbi:MAG: hemerythrin family protein [Verrucomicrobia bacterium]|nr:hemerythrin family protein [Verrucomicrobiota bacterium]
MKILEWNESLSVGVDEIDEQHRTWIARYNSVADAIAERHGAEMVSKILGFLVEYTEEHFATEEARMAEHHYPAEAAHRAKHDELRKTLDGLVQDFREDGPTEELAEAVDTFLGNWLITHIREIDTKLGAFLAERL